MNPPNGSNSHDRALKTKTVSSEVSLSGNVRAVSPLDPLSQSAERYELLDRAYDEFCLLEEAGQAADPDAFCARYPQVQSSLARLLQAHRFLVEHSELLPEEDEPNWPAPGQAHAGFELIRELGKGAFSRVYQARDPALGNRLVTLKLTTLGSEEAATLGPLDHPGIVSAHWARRDEESQLWTICMPYEGSATLHNVLDHLKILRDQKRPLRAASILEACIDPFADGTQSHNPFPAPDQGSLSDGVRRLARQLTEALAVLHERGIQHRDIKPSNILMRPDGAPQLIDFNLAANAQLQTARVGGTPMYMAPEQIQATLEKGEPAAPLDQRADLFSLGVVLYELASGQHPFGPVPLTLASPQLRDLILQRQRQGFVPLRKACPTLDTDLARTIDACLAFEPAQRPQSADDLLKRLRPSWPRRAVRFIARRPVVSCATAALLFVLGGVVAMQMKPVASSEMLQKAQLAYRNGSYDQSRHMLNQVLHMEPENVEALMLRGRTYIRLKDLHSANADFDEADRLRPDGQAKAWRGYCFQLIRQPDAARLAYEQAREKKVRNAALLNNLGTVYMDKNELDKAEEVLREGLLQNAVSQPVRHNLALLCMRRGLMYRGEGQRWFSEGIEHAEAALKIGPRSTDLLVDCATLHALLARDVKEAAEPALVHLKEAIRNGYDASRLHKNSAFSAIRTEVTALQKAPPPVEMAKTEAVRIVEPVVSP